MRSLGPSARAELGIDAVTSPAVPEPRVPKGPRTQVRQFADPDAAEPVSQLGRSSL